MTDKREYTIRKKYISSSDPRLKRHVRHDSRSLLFLAPESDLGTLKSIRHEVHIPTLDQGQLGSCTGNAGTLAIATGALWVPQVQARLSANDAVLDEQFAVALYSAATMQDNFDGYYPPVDTGSDGLSVAKVLKSWGLINGYTHATSLNAALTALAKQPVIIGIGWHDSMYNPTSAGYIAVNGPVVGGHEICLDELDVEKELVWIHNSWSDAWGIEGRACLGWEDLAKLLADDGDCTIFTPLTQPAPIPTPTPDPVVTDPEAEYKAAAVEWLKVKHATKNNVAFEKATKKYFGL